MTFVFFCDTEIFIVKPITSVNIFEHPAIKDVSIIVSFSIGSSIVGTSEMLTVLP